MNRGCLITLAGLSFLTALLPVGLLGLSWGWLALGAVPTLAVGLASLADYAGVTHVFPRQFGGLLIAAAVMNIGLSVWRSSDPLLRPVGQALTLVAVLLGIAWILGMAFVVHRMQRSATWRKQGAQGIQQLITILAQQSTDGRTQAARILGELEATEAVRPLIACLADDNAEVRRHAAQALGQIGDPRAIASLKRLVESAADEGGEEARAAAAAAIDQIRSREQRPI
jgi:hypothetical protein